MARWGGTLSRAQRGKVSTERDGKPLRSAGVGRLGKVDLEAGWGERMVSRG